MTPPYVGPPRSPRWEYLNRERTAASERRTVTVWLCGLGGMLLLAAGIVFVIFDAERARNAAEPCRRYETGTVETKTPEGESARVERTWCAEWKDGGAR